jgi:hypothetical protein
LRVGVILNIFVLSAFATEVTTGPEIAVTDHSATVKWSTDVPTGTRLNYGLNDKLLAHHAEGEVTGQHLVAINDLTPGTTYYYSFGTARVQLGTGKFVTSGGTAPQTQTSTTGAPKPKPPLLERLFPKLVPNNKPSPAPASAPPTRLTWAHLDSLPDHFNRHGGDFNAKSPDDYAAQAWQFLQRAKRDGLPMKWDDSDHSLRVFDPKTRAFASYDGRGKTRTYFKSGNPNYWSGQPGRVITGSQLAF